MEDIMDNNYFLNIVKDACEKKCCTLLAVLYSKENEEFIEKINPDDNIDYPVYIVIYGLTKNTKDKYGSFIYDINYNINKELNKNINIESIHLNSYDSLKDTIESIKRKNTSPFEFIYKLESYKDPDEIITTLDRIGMKIEVDIDRIYSIFISYEELKKLCANKPDKFYQSDLFSLICNNNKELAKLKGHYASREFKETRYDDKGVTFYFYIKEVGSILDDSLNPSGKPQHSSLLKAFEEEDLGNNITTMFKAIINLDEHTEDAE
jgi:hypothetical protein